jgi:hypothetical protein
MKNSSFIQCVFSFCLALVFVPATSHAQIYKWVDANGLTHYSEKKEDAEKAKLTELKVKPGPTSTPESDSLMKNLKEQEKQFKKRQEETQKQNTPEPPVNMPPVSLSDGRAGDSDQSKCNLAKDVLSGAVRHGNGAKTDDYDRELAQREVKAYCHY